MLSLVFGNNEEFLEKEGKNFSAFSVSALITDFSSVKGLHQNDKYFTEEEIKADKTLLFMSILKYLSIYVHFYGYEKTKEFIASREMWESKPNIEWRKAKAQILVNLSHLYLNLAEGKEKDSTLTLRPLFDSVVVLKS